MPTSHRSSSSNFSLAKILCIVFLLCAATAVFSTAQTLITLVNFNGTNGYSPDVAVVQGSDGNLYGTTVQGGASNDCPGGCGTVFQMTPSGTLTTLYSFCSQPGCADGTTPGSLILARDGNFYGVTANGGNSNNCTGGCGTVFKITPSGTLTTLHVFCTGNLPCADGSEPGPLMQATDGNFYGGTENGGPSNTCAAGCGTVFKITPSGALSTLYSFSLTDGSGPGGGLTQATDSNLYGVTFAGGASDSGTVFKITPSGALTTLHSFDVDDGEFPLAALVQATDGNLYGTTWLGGNSNLGTCPIGCGTIFEITLTGTLTTLYTFGGTDGGAPTAGLLQATDGNFYGTTAGGGTAPNCTYAEITGCGTIFKITPAGVLTTLYSFCASTCTAGALPFATLVQATNGNLYGTASGGGANDNCYYGCGTVFSLTGPNPTPLQFIPVTPCRVVDTRQTNGEFGGPPITGGVSRSFPIPQNTMCNIPASAAAYSLNVTAVPITTLGYLTIWPTGESQPVVSTMNSTDGRIKANAAIVPAGGGGGAVSVYVTDTTNVLLDIDGYFAAPGSQTYQFYPLTPCRIVDTRNGDGGMLQAGVERDYSIAGTCGIPTSATAYSFNVTVLPATGGLDYLTVWPQGESQPVVSTLNDDTGTVVANAAILPAGSNSATAFYAHSNATNLLVDVDGYFAAPGPGGLSLYPVAPCRVLDTRQSGGSFVGEKTVNVVGSACAPPSSAAAYVFNATVVPPGPMLYLSLWPDGEQQPVVSTLNAEDGFITSNMAIVPTNNGSIDAYAAALTQLILDISGYFAP
ncbi:MAG: choice-of-anchor tandem repeat GloVer-containing protein [Candidatus Korobacteraceae bacterium]